MRKPLLTSRWWRWQRERSAQLRAAGLPADIAYDIARAEAVTRRRVAAAIGVDAAKAAMLRITMRKGRPVFELIGPTSGIGEVGLAGLEDSGAKFALMAGTALAVSCK